MNRRYTLVLCGFLMVAAPVLAGAPGILKVRILDADHKSIVAARVNVIGSDHAFYEPDPARNPLSAYSLKRKGNRANVGPMRYFGSFFYTDGTFEVELPAGPARIEVSKGYDYYTSAREARVEAGKTTNYDVVLARVVDMPRYGWHTTDTHLHFDRAGAPNDRVIARLLAAEDVELGHILSRESAKGFGMGSLYAEGRYSMVSGREVTIAGLGHMNLLLMDRMIPAVRTSPAPPSGMPIATIYDQVVAEKGALQHDHGGYGQEIYADVVLGRSDWVELLQFGLYRPLIGLEGYYLLLNSGFRYPLAGGSDYGVCRTMSDSRTYVADGRKTTFPTAMGRLLRGESFATSGPLLFLSVGGRGPGSDIEFTGTSPESVEVRVKAVSGELPFDAVEIVEDGKVVQAWHGPQPVFERELKTTLQLSASTWIAARCSGPNTVHAHTNPVWVCFNGLAPFQAEAASELQRRIRQFEGSVSSAEVKAVAQRAAHKLEQMLAAGKPPARPVTAYGERFPVSRSDAVLFPPVLPRPKPLAAVTLEGTVVDSRGKPLAEAQVSACGVGPAAPTDAGGRFRLSGVDINRALFLRVTMPGHATTNTAYLNPRAPRENVRILLLTDAELQALVPDGKRAAPRNAARAILLVHSADADGKPIPGLEVGQPGAEHFAHADGEVQFVGLANISYQPSDPPQANDLAPNVILTAEPLGKDIVLPVFAGQASYAVILDTGRRR